VELLLPYSDVKETVEELMEWGERHSTLDTRHREELSSTRMDTQLSSTHLSMIAMCL
jgi:hypothetical protein